MTAQISFLPAPGSDEELVALYADLPRAACTWCGGQDAVTGSCCPRSIACPCCGARPGRRCKRPSEHDAAEMHRARVVAAEAIDRDRLGASSGVRDEAAP